MPHIPESTGASHSRASTEVVNQLTRKDFGVTEPQTGEALIVWWSDYEKAVKSLSGNPDSQEAKQEANEKYEAYASYSTKHGLQPHPPLHRTSSISQ